MYCLRPLCPHDFEMLWEFAQQAQVGMTNLPKHRETLRKISDHALASFHKQLPKEQAYYLFCLEDLHSKKLVGVSGIFASTGGADLLEYYAIRRHSFENPLKESIPAYHLLEKILYPTGPSELCSLYLTPQARKEGLGKLLSLGRLLFIHSFPDYFTSSIFADMRGWIDERNISPFWEAVGRKFLPMDFTQFMDLRTQDPHISRFLPDRIYLEMLPAQARAVIGTTHGNTRPALHMLERQGFNWSQEVDLFDAGPRIMAQINKLHLLQKIKKGSFKPRGAEGAPKALICNGAWDFRCCLGALNEEQGHGETTLFSILEMSSQQEVLYAFL